MRLKMPLLELVEEEMVKETYCSVCRRDTEHVLVEVDKIYHGPKNHKIEKDNLVAYRCMGCNAETDVR